VERRGDRDAGEGPFSEAYAAVVKREPPSARAAELAARMAPTEPVALRGMVLTAAGARDGYVVVGADKRIAGVSARKPDGVRLHDTENAVICPGLIDLHGHPDFNVFAAWEPPRRYSNRYQWRREEPLYQTLIRDPANRLRRALPAQTLLRYAEIRALVGGVTAIQGTTKEQGLGEESLVRHVDRWILGDQVGSSMIDLPSNGRGREDLDEILADIAAGRVKAFYLHLAEGHPEDEESRGELGRLVELGALSGATVVIHGSALSEGQLGDLRDAGAKLVWSPQSNLRLYGETTKAAAALKLGLNLGLGADWLPSGSASLLAELKVARHRLTQQGLDVGARKLVEMVTSDAAAIAGLADKLGAIEAGRPADLVVFERRHEDPYENVVQADPSSVELVMIDGELSYGRYDWVDSLSAPGEHERPEEVVAWGRRMLLDTTYAARPSGMPPTLAELRARLIAQYPQVGPIFA